MFFVCILLEAIMVSLLLSANIFIPTQICINRYTPTISHLGRNCLIEQSLNLPVHTQTHTKIATMLLHLYTSYLCAKKVIIFLFLLA